MTLKDMISDLKPEEVEEFFNSLMLEENKDKKLNGVSLLTIHKSKGLEFNTVFVIGCNEGILPGFSKRDKDLEEDRRVFYVAITRAKQRLYISAPQMEKSFGKDVKTVPSIIFKDLLEKYVNC